MSPDVKTSATARGGGPTLFHSIFDHQPRQTHDFKNEQEFSKTLKTLKEAYKRNADAGHPPFPNEPLMAAVDVISNMWNPDQERANTFLAHMRVPTTRSSPYFQMALEMYEAYTVRTETYMSIIDDCPAAYGCMDDRYANYGVSYIAQRAGDCVDTVPPELTVDGLATETVLQLCGLSYQKLGTCTPDGSVTYSDPPATAVDEVDGDQRPFVTDRVPDATMDVGNEPALLEDGQIRHAQAPDHDPDARVVRRAERAALFLGNPVQTKRRQLFGRRRRQHQRQHDARRSRQQAGRTIFEPVERRLDSLRLELPVPAPEGQRHRCGVACAFDEAEERREPGNEIVHVVVGEREPRRVCSWKAAREVRDGGVRLAARARAELAARAAGDDHVDAVAVRALRRYQGRERRRRAPLADRQLLTITLVDDGHDRMFQTRAVGGGRRRDARPQVVPVVPWRGRRAARRHEIHHERRHWLGDANVLHSASSLCKYGCPATRPRRYRNL